MKPTVKLDADASYRLIENAVRTQAQLVLDAVTWCETAIHGFLISGDTAALLVELSGQLAVPIERILNARCRARLHCDQRYWFPTTVMAVPEWGNSRSLAIARPKTVSVLERRRFLRANLAPSAEINLSWQRAGATRHHVAAMLNISAEGMACRIDDDVAGAIKPDDLIGLEFEFPDLHRVFNLRATVSNMTPASEGCTILGLQFAGAQVQDVADQLEALREALREPSPAATDSEVCV